MLKIIQSWRFWAVVLGVVNLHLSEIQSSLDTTVVFTIISEILVGAGIIRTVDRAADRIGTKPA